VRELSGETAMRSNRFLLALLLASLSGSMASTCVLVEEGPADVAYGEESAEQQTQDEQMREVDEQIEE
jgi:hypothetical protein